MNVGRLSELGFEGFRPKSRFGGGLEATMQFAIQASMQRIKVLPNPGVHLRRHVTASASPQLDALRVGCVGSFSCAGALASPFLAPRFEALQLPAKPTTCSAEESRFGSVRAEAKVGVGAYDRDVFSNEIKANKIAQVMTIQLCQLL